MQKSSDINGCLEFVPVLMFGPCSSLTATQMLESTAESLVVTFLQGAIELVVKGNKKDMEALKSENCLDATYQVNQQVLKGKHYGPRCLSKGKRSWSVKSFGFKRYRLLAQGPGEFRSSTVTYKGDMIPKNNDA